MEMMDVNRKARMFKALGSPQRLALFERLRRAEAKCRTTDADAAMCVCDLADCVDVGLSTVSHHLKELKDAGLVTTEKRGRTRECRIAPGDMDEVTDWIEHYRRMWEQRLDRLEAYLEQQKEGER
jgi:DNA-binding transcriptional ArsR family regulator